LRDCWSEVILICFWSWSTRTTLWCTDPSGRRYQSLLWA